MSYWVVLNGILATLIVNQMTLMKLFYSRPARLNPQGCYFLVLLGSVVAMAAALYMQHGKGLQPCTMCIIQRYAFVICGLCALVALLIPVRFLQVLLAITGVASALMGIGAAIRNLWVMAHPDVLCGRDPVEIFLNSLPTAQWQPEVFMATGLCSSPIPPLLGLSLPAWSLIGLLGLMILFGVAVRSR